VLRFVVVPAGDDLLDLLDEWVAMSIELWTMPLTRR